MKNKFFTRKFEYAFKFADTGKAWGSKMKKPKISVIIPVYNSEEYISVTLDSILNQTFKSYEILLINDGSTDNSLSILNQYQAKQPDKIQVITQENAGAGAARNTGIKNATGKYILFIDSDDTVEDNMLSDLYASAVKYRSEVVICPFYRHGLYQEVTMEGTFNFSSRKVYTGSDFIKNTEHIITTCTKLYLADFIRRFTFPTFWFEDVALLPVLMSYAQKITYVPRAYYHYIRHGGSTISNISNERVLGSIDAVRYIKENANPELIHEMAPYIAELLLYMCIRRPAFSDLYINLLIEYKDYIMENTDTTEYSHLYARIKPYFDDKYVSIPKRIFYDHFGKSPLTPVQEENIKTWQGTLVEFDTEIICLNEENCDITEHPLVEKAYNEGHFDTVGQYFKCKRLMEQGGIALSPNIQGIKCIVRLLTRTQAFFAFYDDTSISSAIYASAPREKGIQDAFTLLLEHISDNDAMSAALTELLMQKNGITYSYEWESSFKSKYSRAYDGRVRIYSTNVLTWDYGLGTTIAAIRTEEPAAQNRDGRTYCEVNAFYYRTLKRLTTDYVQYRKDMARQDFCSQNIKLQKKIAKLRTKTAEQADCIDTLRRKNSHYLSLIDDIKSRKLVWLVYRISLKFFKNGNK